MQYTLWNKGTMRNCYCNMTSVQPSTVISERLAVVSQLSQIMTKSMRPALMEKRAAVWRSRTPRHTMLPTNNTGVENTYRLC